MGCFAKIAMPTPKRVMIRPKMVDYVFIGYANNSSTGRFLVHHLEIIDIHTNMIMELRNASFFKMCFLVDRGNSKDCG